MAAEGDPTLQRFLAYAGVELSDLARPTIGGWVGLRHPARCRELVELADALDEQADHVTRPLSDLPGCDALTDGPLHLHASYSRDEILAAFGILQSGQRPSVREGVKHDEATNTDIFFVTVHKTEDHYSPTTMYRDYPISRELFHWESQSITTRTSPTGRRYLEGRSRIVLFVQERKTGASGAAPYLCLGPATLVEARGERPIAITWRLHHPMPQTFLDTASALVASRAEGLLGPRHRSTSPMRLVHPARRH